MTPDAARVLIIGVGNPYRGDDGVGIVVVRQLSRQVPPEVTVIEESGEGTALVEAWKGYDFVVVVDAIKSGAVPGSIRRFDATDERIPSDFFRHSTHAFGVWGAIELARTLNELPSRLVVYGIEGQNFAPGQTLSPIVEKVVRSVAAQILFEARPTQQDINVCVAAGCLSLHSDLLKQAQEEEAVKNGTLCRRSRGISLQHR
jgi:hydrogenase maturation protease